MMSSPLDAQFRQVDDLLPRRLLWLFSTVESLADDDDDVIAAFVLFKMRTAVIRSRIQLEDGTLGLDYTVLGCFFVELFESLVGLATAFDDAGDLSCELFDDDKGA